MFVVNTRLQEIPLKQDFFQTTTTRNSVAPDEELRPPRTTHRPYDAATLD